jgi:hypothetical protein
LSKIAAMCGTASPAISRSKSTKLPPLLLKKYSSAMLRPPATANAPSAMSILLCMRWLTREKSPSAITQRVSAKERPEGKGLKRRTSTLG